MKIYLYALVGSVLLLACQHNDRWRNVTIRTGNEQFDSSKLIYPATNFCHDLEMEFLYTGKKLHAYINVYAETIPCYQEDTQVALLVLDVKGHQYDFLVDRLSGGQRLKIPDDSLNFMLGLLEKYPYVTLTLGNAYRTKINALDFNKHFKMLKAKKLSMISSNPISLAL